MLWLQRLAGGYSSQHHHGAARGMWECILTAAELDGTRPRERISQITSQAAMSLRPLLLSLELGHVLGQWLRM